MTDSYRDPQHGASPQERATVKAEVNLIKAEGRNRVAEANREQGGRNEVASAQSRGAAAIIDARLQGQAGFFKELFGGLGPVTKGGLKTIGGLLILAAAIGVLHAVAWSYNSLTSRGGQAEQAVAQTRDLVNQAITGNAVEADLRRELAQERERNTQLQTQLDARITSGTPIAVRGQIEGFTQCTQDLATCRLEVGALTANRLTQDACNQQILTTCNGAIRQYCPEAPPLQMRRLNTH